MTSSFTQVISCIIELEKLKQVDRKTRPPGLDRYENSAEHSWQIALLALGLLPYGATTLDTLKVVTMLLIHDVVEIDTGDKFAYDANHDDYANELKAAERIFGLLPPQTGEHFLSLWKEFEAAQSAEAQFAKGIDRLMPVLQNIHNGCQSWLENQITLEQVLQKNVAVASVHPELWEIVQQQIIAAGEAAGVPRY